MNFLILSRKYCNIILLILFIPAASASLHMYSLNSSQLPFSTNYSYVVNFDVNTTFNVSYQSWLSGISSVNLSNSSSYSLNININIPQSNPDVYEKYFNVTKTYNNVSIIDQNSFIFVITNVSTPQNITNQTNFTPWMMVGLNSYVYDLCTYMIPKNFTHTISLGGSPGALVNVSCNSNYMSCPSNFVFNSNGLYSLGIYFLVDEYYSSTEQVFFVSGNQSIGNVSFAINIKDCIAPLELPECSEFYYRCTDKFNYTYEEKIDCKEMEISCDMAQLKLMRYSQQTIYQNFTDVKYVEKIIDLNDKVAQKIEAIFVAMDEYKSMKVAYDLTEQKVEELKNIENESAAFRAAMPGLFREYAEGLSVDNLNKTNALIEMREQTIYKRKLYEIIGFCAVGVVLLGVGIISWKENQIPG